MDLSIEEITEKIISIFKKQLALNEIELNRNYFSGDVANSIDALKILVQIEEMFEIEIDDDDLSAELISSIKGIVDYIFKKIN